ncbi:MAG: hypothetical protein IT389_16020 [Nitrospira sp.]|nr:hypothetical protein [Nitrospira sp.]
MFRVMLVLGLLVLVPAAIVFWRMRDRAVMAPPPPPVSQKAIGTSTLNHGGPRRGNHDDPRLGKGTTTVPGQSE